MNNNTTFVVVALVAAVALFGVVVVTVITITQEAEAIGCRTSKAVDASKGRCLR